MMDGLLGRGFSFKCKTLIKASRARIEVVRRRAEARQRFLKEDLVKLLSDGLDINAYNRTEEYIAGINLLSCYDFLEQSCEYIVKQLSRMEKQGECPEECREAIATLMFAAARLSDLPELRDLRDVFQQRYGSCLDVYVNQKFIEKLSSKAHTTTKKLQVLQDIASEFSIKWDSRGFEQRIAAPSIVTKVDEKRAELLKQRPGKEYRGKSSSHGDDKILFHGRRHRQTKDKHSYFTEKGAKELKPNSSSSHGKILDNVRHSNGIYNPDKLEGTEALFGKKGEFARNYAENPGKFENGEHSNQNNKRISTRKEPQEESDGLKSCSTYALPPPYVKAKGNIALLPYTKPKEDEHLASSGPSTSKQAGSYLDGQLEKELAHHGEKIPVPKPLSVRKKHHKSSSDYDVKGSFEEVGTAKRSSSSSRRKEPSRKGLEIWFDEEQGRKDEDEKVIDKLLIHYSKKPSSYDAEKVRKYIISTNAGESSRDRIRDVHKVKYEVAPPPTRSVSLPKEQTDSQESKKVFTRANTFQADNQARHVHPKLPDYDDLAARFAALRGR
ncbi:hypothetical protein ACJIZ3_024461 [Penstemon smallii]|uniref:Vacuolar protein sorting-associated protein Ist1 n=1 Tax=Penstemon smallii TaxID=265156 RepID=A0ABD3TS46_9LAMI